MSTDWDELAALDPLWTVLTDPAKRGNRWELDEFWETGRGQFDATLERLEALGWSGPLGAALDFGCGVGRMTAAIAPNFDTTLGVDVSPKMIELARSHHDQVDGLSFDASSGTGLEQLEPDSFDLVHTILVLQHIPSAESILNHIDEFARVARPGGAIVFDVPVEVPWKYRLHLKRRVYKLLRSLGVSAERLHDAGLTTMTMTAVSPTAISQLIDKWDLETLLIDEQDKGAFTKRFYYLRKPSE